MARTVRWLAVVGALVVGCKDRDSRSSAAPEQTLRFQLFGDSAEIDAYRKLARAYEARRPGTRVELTPVANQRDFMAKLTTSFAAGTPPDLFLINYRRFGQFAGKGVLEPLGPYLARSAVLEEGDLYEQAVGAFRFNGELTCIPQNISSLVVYFNRSHFQRAGLAFPKDDWTWDDFADTAWKLTRDEDGDGRAEVYGLGLEPSLTRLAPFIWQGGGDVVDNVAAPTRLTAATAGAAEGMTFAWSLRQLLRVVPSLEEAKSEDHERRFARGGLSMLLNSRRLTPALRAVKDLDWDVAPLPRGKYFATVLHSDAYCVPRTSKVKEAAFAFVEFAVGEQGGAIIAESGRTVPSHRKLSNSESFLQPKQRPASSKVFLDSIQTVRRLPNIARWHEIETRVDPELEEWFYGVPVEMPRTIKEASKNRHLTPRPFRGPVRHRAALSELSELSNRLDLVTSGLLGAPAK